MEKRLRVILAKLEKECAAEQVGQNDQADLLLAPGQLVPACRLLLETGFELLSFLTAVDYWPQESPRFHVVYGFTSVSHNLRLSLRVPLPGTAPLLPSICSLYGNANWRERELWDMFGIKAEGHPDLRRLLMPADWEGHPLRKDYPLGYEEPQFSFNLEEIKSRKPFARE